MQLIIQSVTGQIKGTCVFASSATMRHYWSFSSLCATAGNKQTCPRQILAKVRTYCLMLCNHVNTNMRQKGWLHPSPGSSAQPGMGPMISAMTVRDILGKETRQKSLCRNSREEEKYAKHGKLSYIIFPWQAESQSVETLKELILINL